MLELKADVPMYLYSMSKKMFVLLFASFVVLFGVSVIIGFVGPEVYEIYTTYAAVQGIDMTINQTHFVWEIEHLDQLNQYVYLDMTLYNKRYTSQSVGSQLQVSTIFSGSEDGDTYTQISNAQNVPYTVSCTVLDPKCANITLAKEPFIRYPFYTIDISFTNQPGMDWIQDVQFTWKVANHSFTLFEMWFRFIFLLASFCFAVFFAFKLRIYRFRKWNFEQKWTMFLLLSLMGYNDPFFPLTILSPNPFPPFLDAFLIATFIALILFFWISLFDGIRTLAMKRTFFRFYLPKFILIFLLWVALLGVYEWEQINQLDNPSYSSQAQVPGYIFFRVVQYILVAIYVIYFAYIIVRAVGDKKTVPLLRDRLNFPVVLTILVIIITVVGMFVGFVGYVDASAAQFLSIFSLLNLYVWVLAIIYAPIGHKVETPGQPAQKEPAMVAIESDDDDDKGNPKAIEDEEEDEE